MRLLAWLGTGLFTAALAACGGGGGQLQGSGGGGGQGPGGAGGGASTTSSSHASSTATTTGTGGATSSSSTSTGTGGAGMPSLMSSVNPTTIPAGSTATVSVTVQNFDLVAPGGPNMPGEGHYHVYLDGATGGNYLAADQAPTTTITMPVGTTPGAHSLRVNITNNDHSPLAPPVQVTLPITVQ